MAKAQYIGVGNVARKVKKQYIGVGGIAREVKKGYIGVGGVARQYLSSEVTVTITGHSWATDAEGSSYHPCFVTINGKRYTHSAAKYPPDPITVNVSPGTVATVTVTGTATSPSYKAEIKLRPASSANFTTVASGYNTVSYDYTVNGNVTIDLQATTTEKEIFVGYATILEQ